MADTTTVLICAEIEAGRLSATTKELLSAGKELTGALSADLGALILGSDIKACAREAIAYGADKVYLADNTALADYGPEAYTDAITQACRQIQAKIILLGQTAMGRDVAGRVAYRLGCVACTDCLKLELDPQDKSLVQTRSVFGGMAVARFTAPDAAVRLATLRPKTATPLERDSARTGATEDIAVTIEATALKTRLIETVKEAPQGVSLEEAKVVVAGGGGIGAAEGFSMLQALADIWGGAVGTTTVPFDEGWVPTAAGVIGDSGKTVKPDLYFAVGIRGASQHITGCADSKMIVAINKDADATMFNVSDLGVVSDYRKVLPALIAKCKALKEG